MSERLAKEVSELVVERSGKARDSILRDLGFYRTIERSIRENCSQHYKQFTMDTVSHIIYEIFTKDSRITNLMASKDELVHTKCILKTDFSFIISDCLCVGKNKSRELIDDLLLRGDLITVQNIMDTNAKMVRPALIDYPSLRAMLDRIHAAKGLPQPTDAEYKKFVHDEDHVIKVGGEE